MHECFYAWLFHGVPIITNRALIRKEPTKPANVSLIRYIGRFFICTISEMDFTKVILASSLLGHRRVSELNKASKL